MTYQEILNDATYYNTVAEKLKMLGLRKAKIVTESQNKNKLYYKTLEIIDEKVKKVYLARSINDLNEIE